MIYSLLTAVIYALDQSVKEHVNSDRIQGTTEKKLGGRVILRNCHNEGLMLGILGKKDEASVREISTLVLGGVLWETIRTKPHDGGKLSKLGLAMVLGGGLNNYLERKKRGYVTDYVSFDLENEKLKKVVFNISDFFIFAGSAMWAVGNFLSDRRK